NPFLYYSIDNAFIQNNIIPQNKLGYFYKNDVKVQIDLKNALNWYQIIVKNNNKLAQYYLGLYYLYGWIIEKDEVKAFELLKKSADQEQSNAQNYLGYCYENGIGIQKNIKEAYNWYQKAANNENKLAQYNLDLYYQNEFQDNNNLVEEFKISKNTENQNIDDNFNPFNCIQFDKPTVDVINSNKSYIWNNINDEVNSEFISLKATISPGISATSYIEVEKLQKLLISRKDDIDCILKSQPVYIIGIDFQKNSTSPCIACWVAKPLEIPILECLETMFEDQDDYSKYNNGNGDSNGTGYDLGNGDGKGDINNKIYVYSKVNAKVMNLDIFQDFYISASLSAKTTFSKKEVRILEYDINLNGCGVGDMLSNSWPPLKRLGFGYFLHSIEVQITPTPDIMNNLFWLNFSQPTQSNRKLEFSTDNENTLQVGTSSGIIGGRRMVHNTKFSSNEWKLSYKGPFSKGERWLYQYIDNDLDKDGSNRECFAPGSHSGQWLTKKEMQGFCITITQVLRCEITYGWRRRFLPQSKPKLLQLCPMMCHSLKVTFNDLQDINEKLTNLNQPCYDESINIIVGSNEAKNINKTENQKIQHLNGEINCSTRIV
ncbi:4892_t:CDS:2, partial [Funneliformis geosporum]